VNRFTLFDDGILAHEIKTRERQLSIMDYPLPNAGISPSQSLHGVHDTPGFGMVM